MLRLGLMVGVLVGCLGLVGCADGVKSPATPTVTTSAIALADQADTAGLPTYNDAYLACMFSVTHGGQDNETQEFAIFCDQEARQRSQPPAGTGTNIRRPRPPSGYCAGLPNGGEAVCR